MANTNTYINKIVVPNGSDTITANLVDTVSGYTKNTGTVTTVTAGAGLNTTSDDTATDGGSITTSGTLYLTKSGVTAGSYGSDTKIPEITVDKYGRITGVTATTISGSGLTGVVKYMGVVEDTSLLPTPSSSSGAVGDAYYVTNEETLYIWVAQSSGGSTTYAWEPVGTAIDTSLFLTSADLESSTGSSTSTGMTQYAITTALNTKANASSVPTKVSDLLNDSNFVTTSEMNTAIGSAQSTLNQAISTITDRIVIDTTSTKMVDATYTSYVMSGNGIVSTVISGTEQFNVQADGAHATVYSSGDWHIQKMNNNKTWAFFRKQ